MGPPDDAGVDWDWEREDPTDMVCVREREFVCVRERDLCVSEKEFESERVCV
jgi:hypothetical protein